MKRIATVAALAALCSACTFHSTDSTEVGVLTRKITFFGLLGHKGIQDEAYPPGATYTFPAFITDWNVFNVALQNLEMVAAKERGDRLSRDDIEFKTHDGNDIAVDVTVAWRIDAKKVAYLLGRVGGSTNEVKEHLVRPACRSIVRDVLNTMTSEEFYVSDKRFEKAEQARQKLALVLAPEGVLVERVILGEHRFNPEYEKVIHDKKLAEQTAERMVSEGNAAQQEA
ncbi:MAG TPA: SPFH domain-containing protein, partial [Myxococcales bacterium]|nr:SPFH domain-containing protein [Myxococcales bacterium]